MVNNLASWLADKGELAVSRSELYISVRSFVDAIEENITKFYTNLGQVPWGEVELSREIAWMITGMPSPTFNAVLRSQLPPQYVDATIEQTLKHFQARQVPMMWWVGPSTHPADLAASLVRHGFTYADNVPGMAIDLSMLPETVPAPRGLTIERVTDGEMLKQWVWTWVRGWGHSEKLGEEFYKVAAFLGFGSHSPYRHYLARLHDRPVATASLFFNNESVGIYHITTLPEFRRQGIGAAITLSPLQEARDLNARIGILFSSPQGFKIYRALGFEVYCTLHRYEKI